jgi:hypothetical protein
MTKAELVAVMAKASGGTKAAGGEGDAGVPLHGLRFAAATVSA